MDLQYVLLDKSKQGSDLKHDSLRLYHIHLNKDLCISDLYKQGVLGIRNCLCTQAYSKVAILQNRSGTNRMVSLIFLCIANSGRMVKEYMGRRWVQAETLEECT